MVPKASKNLLLLVFISACLACSSDRLIDDFQRFENNEWSSEHAVNFLVNVSDTTKSYDIHIHIRNSNNYEYSNLWLFIETKSPAGNSMRDTVEFTLADNSGRWLGSGLGSINSLLLPYKYNIRFPYRGIYSFSFRQAMRKDIITGINDIGIRIEEHR